MPFKDTVTACLLPSDIAGYVYGKYLSMKELVRLDSAINNHAIRIVFLSSLSQIQLSTNPQRRKRLKRINITFRSLCFSWLMCRGICVNTLTVPKFDSQSMLTHCSIPDRLDYVYNIVVPEIGLRGLVWWHSLISACCNLITLQINGISMAMFDAIATMVVFLPLLEEVTLAGDLSRHETTLHNDAEMLGVMLHHCKKLRQVCIYVLEMHPESILGLIYCNIAFMVTIRTATYAHNSMLSVCNVASINATHYFLWQNMPEEIITKYMLQTAKLEQPNTTRLHVHSLPNCEDLVYHAYKMEVLLVLEIDNCTYLTQSSFTLLVQLPNLYMGKLCTNNTIECMDDQRRWSSKVYSIQLRGFTALTARTVKTIASNNTKTRIELYSMPHLNWANCGYKSNVWVYEWYQDVYD